jgi:hypothetical protein
MTTLNRALLPTLAAILAAGPAVAQTSYTSADAANTSAATVQEDTVVIEERAAAASLFREVTMQYFTPMDQRGVNQFEQPKVAGVPFTGFRMDWGAAFTQQFQSLSHSNTAAPRMAVVNGQEVDQNALLPIGAGFNLATANLYLNAQLAPGIRVTVESYMSSRGHSEFWVKGGYLQFDQSPIDLAPLNTLMDYATLKVGHFEVNYGDAHFRRSDNGQALLNPFVGNYILDSFTTEIGAELYLRHAGLMGMVGVTSGEIKGAVDNPDRRSWGRYAKLGFDRQLNGDLRVRLMGSAYTTDKSMNQTLFSGDRAGSRYYEVLVNAVGGNRWSGHIQPGFRNQVTSYQVNPFVKFRGLELFGVIEQAEGKAAAEASTRTWNHYAADGVYRFFGDRLYVAGRYNTAAGHLQNVANEVSVDRWQAGGGWFVAPTVLLKAEYVNQRYNDFPTADIRNGGRFNGFVLEGAVSF